MEAEPVNNLIEYARKCLPDLPLETAAEAQRMIDMLAELRAEGSQLRADRDRLKDASTQNAERIVLTESVLFRMLPKNPIEGPRIGT